MSEINRWTSTAADQCWRSENIHPNLHCLSGAVPVVPTSDCGIPLIACRLLKLGSAEPEPWPMVPTNNAVRTALLFAKCIMLEEDQ